MIDVICTLWPGGDFGPEDVTALRVGVEEHLTTPHRFLCITDEAVDCDSVPFETDWWTHAGWWGKLEAFREDLGNHHRLYLDLDTLPVGDMSHLAALRYNFAGMRDVYVPARLQASVLSFNPRGAAQGLLREYRNKEWEIRDTWRGDQWWFTDTLPNATRLQDETPGIYSLKVHAEAGPPDDAVLIVAHGKPRLSDPAAGWAHEVWGQRANTTTEGQ